MASSGTDKSRRELWHQIDGRESNRAYSAFRVFMLLPPADRTVIAAWRTWSGNPDARREPPYFYNWARNLAWSERSRARDHHLEVLREAGSEEAIREEATRQARAVEQVRGRFNELMAITYEKAIEYLEEDDFATQLRPADVVQILKLHLETVHKLGDSGTEAAGSSATVDWSDDEQRELDAILGKIEAEEDLDERGSGSDGGEESPEEGEGVSD
jgi:hypothetical protein